MSKGPKNLLKIKYSDLAELIHVLMKKAMKEEGNMHGGDFVLWLREQKGSTVLIQWEE